MWAMSVPVDFMIMKHIILHCVDTEEEEKGGECSKNTTITDSIVSVMQVVCVSVFVSMSHASKLSSLNHAREHFLSGKVLKFLIIAYTFFSIYKSWLVIRTLYLTTLL
jgi:hypothetical protein